MELDEILLKALLATANLKDEFRKTGRWHIDCPCPDCAAVQVWQNLSPEKKQIAWDAAKATANSIRGQGKKVK